MAILPAARDYRFLLLYRNILLGRHGATVTADSEDPAGNTPASKLLTEWKVDAWRSGSVATRSGAGTPEFRIKHVLAGAETIDFVALEWSNLQLPWRADLYAGDPDAAGTLLDSTDWTEPIVQSAAGDFAEYPGGVAPGKLQPTAAHLAELAADFRLKTFQTFAAPVAGVDHVVFRIDCTAGANGTVDYVQMSLPYAGLAWRPTFNPVFGPAIEPVFRSLARSSASGAYGGLGRRLHKACTISLELLSDDEVSELTTDWLEREGEFARVFCWREPGEDKRRFFYDFQGAFTGIGKAFSGIGIEKPESATGGIVVAKTIEGIRIEETE